MSSPSLLEYHLISRRPFGGLLSKRLPIWWVRFRVPHDTWITPNRFCNSSLLRSRSVRTNLYAKIALQECSLHNQRNNLLLKIQITEQSPP